MNIDWSFLLCFVWSSLVFGQDASYRVTRNSKFTLIDEFSEPLNVTQGNPPIAVQPPSQRCRGDAFCINLYSYNYVVLIKVPASVRDGPIYVGFQDGFKRSIVVFFHYGAKQNLPAETPSIVRQHIQLEVEYANDTQRQYTFLLDGPLEAYAPPDLGFVVIYGRQTAEPMHFGLVGRDSTHSVSFAMDGTDEIPKHRHYYFLTFNSARALNSMGALLVILCALAAPTFF